MQAAKSAGGMRMPFLHSAWVIALAAMLLAQHASSESHPAAPSAPAAPAHRSATALADAARSDDAKSLRALIPQTADVDAPDADGTSALHWVVRRGRIDLARLLIAAGADPNRPSRLGLRPLYLAAANGDAAMAGLLIKAGADPNAAAAYGESMLMAAVDSRNLATVKALLGAGAQVDARDPHYEQTALMFAARDGLPDIAEALIAAGAKVDARTRLGEEPAWVLPNSRKGFSFGVGIIRGGWPADRGMRPFRRGNMTPLLYAARDGHTKTAKVLLDAGADINAAEANAITPLLMAISNDRMELAKLLIARGARLDAQDWYGRSPLWTAVRVRNLYLDNNTLQSTIDRAPVLEIIRMLLEKGADPNPRTKEAPPPREYLLPITWSLEWVDFTGQTPFLAAARAGDVTVMRLLLQHGADPSIATFGGTTPLMAAAGINWVVSQSYTEGPAALLEAVKLCRALGNDVNAVNSMGLTAIDGAANRGSDDIIEYLVSQGARLDVKDKEGRTPLDWARGVFLATHPAEPKPSSIALIERLMKH
ncbi:MAG TPA: ankyrin repeat domain-containing protein [Gammaproteobacteria bacterium]|nr:ankyrin repeat domain-containing protein [Gammaproteobacteria bacterium]